MKSKKSKGGQGAREIMAKGGRLPPLLLPVPCGAMTVIGVSTLPLKEVDAYGKL
ncbi:hypothetical protein ES703_99969 [subsurface metagenome]